MWQLQGQEGVLRRGASIASLPRVMALLCTLLLGVHPHPIFGLPHQGLRPQVVVSSRCRREGGWQMQWGRSWGQLPYALCASMGSRTCSSPGNEEDLSLQPSPSPLLPETLLPHLQAGPCLGCKEEKTYHITTCLLT